MKLTLVFFLMLVVNIHYNFAQNISERQRKDSIEISSPDKEIFNGLSGYGSMISYDDFKKAAAVSPMLLIQGKVPGFVVNSLNVNDPNPDLQIQTRGISTLYLSTEPLYIIDGIPMGNPDIVPVENIESIEVLKSLSETSVYGIRGVNGVVVIKTKKNNSKPFTVSYNTYMYGETFAKKSSSMSASEWRVLKQDWASSTYPELRDRSNEMNDYNANTDWRKEISQNILSQAHHLGFFGSYKKTSYSVMLNYNNYKGIIQKTGNTTYSGQISVSQLALKDKLQVDLSVIRTSRKYREINDNPYLTRTDADTGLKNYNIISMVNRYNPTVSVLNPDNTNGRDNFYERDHPYGNIFNPVENLSHIIDNRQLKNTLVHIQASYALSKVLELSGSWSQNTIALQNVFSRYYQNMTAVQYLGATRETNDQKERLYALKLNYNKSIAFHHLNILLAYSNQSNRIHYEYRDSTTNNSGLIDRSNEFNKEEYDIYNLLGTVKYNYNNKYYFFVSLLKENSLLYNWDESAQYFPSFSGAWSLTNENFLKKQSWINDLKIRVGYGVGQRTNHVDYYWAKQYISLPINKDHGEKLKEHYAGVDMGFLSNRLCFSVDYYHRKTRDGVFLTKSPHGELSLPNEAEIQNKGWEFYVKAQPLVNKLKWAFDFNISYNKNVANSDYKSIKDQPVGNFLGYQFVGYTDLNDILVVDNEGNITEFDWGDREKLGNGVPKSFFGCTNTFEYKNFDLSICLRGALGFSMNNLNKYDHLDYGNFQKTTLTDDQRNIMKQNIMELTDFHIEKGDYLKIDYISLGYTIPIEKRFSAGRVRVYIACNNVALFTKATDADPEMAGINGLYPGNYNYERYPQTRIFLGGLKVLF